MTFFDLSNEVAALGFAESIERDNLLTTATNLALRELYNSRPVLKTRRFAKRGQKPILYRKEMACAPGERIEFLITGRAYSFRISGTCQFMIKYGEDFTSTSVNTGPEAQLFRGFASPGSTITFFGSYYYNIFDFSIYEKTFSDDREDIPDGSPTTTYDLRQLHEDFLSFISPATDPYGKEIACCRLYDGKVELSSDYNGEVILTYRRMPTTIEGKIDDVIDLPEEYRHIFPLLVASYVWLDTEDAKAKYYRTLYEKNLAIIDSARYGSIDSSYRKINGWA